jgi:hypothetical protein
MPLHGVRGKCGENAIKFAAILTVL